MFPSGTEVSCWDLSSLLCVEFRKGKGSTQGSVLISQTVQSTPTNLRSLALALAILGFHRTRCIDLPLFPKKSYLPKPLPLPDSS